MLSHIQYEDHFIFNIKECLEQAGYKSKGPIFQALAELLAKEFIAKTNNQFVYWINPRLFWKGKRLVLLKEYRKVKEEQIKDAS